MIRTMSGSKLGRRSLLKVLGAGSGALCAGVAGCAGSLPEVGDDQFVSLPAVVQGRLVIPLMDFPQLVEVGGAVVGVAQGMDGPLAIARETETKFSAMPAICTHMACILRYNRLNATLDCPCHGSSFELDGTVINGPATRALTRWTTEFDGQAVRILLSR
jgi:cytochrome b6-f complex iron-sulfur subunit